VSYISYEDDEVNVYHPFFETQANAVLVRKGLDSDIEWIHHGRSPSNSLIPDFILREKASKRWLLALEIKRTPSSIYSTRNQIQAQGYVLENVGQYHPDKPKYYVISNLEQIILFAHRNGQTPRYCRLKDGIFQVGTFTSLDAATFSEKLRNQLDLLLDVILSGKSPVYDVVWPQIIDEYVSFASSAIDAPELSGGKKSPNWAIVRDFFCQAVEYERLLIFYLRCLLVDYLRALLEKHEHDLRSQLIPLVNDSLDRLPSRLANIFDQLRKVDFSQLFEKNAITQYRNLHNADTKIILQKYITKLLDSDIYHNALRRLDNDDLIDDMLVSTHPNIDLATRGKVRTDPELAKLLVNLTILEPTRKILDPCCGDGILLEAAYYKLKSFGISYQDNITSLAGFECDELLLKLCYLRLVLKEPALVRADLHLELYCENMFDQSVLNSDVILMNPPFMRYESMRIDVPQELKDHYAFAIKSVKDSDSISIIGQQNLFTYYVEYILSASKQDCKIGIILDNKWYHNRYGKHLRKFILENSKILAIVEYPFHNLFEKRMIATSILVCQKSSTPPDHKIKFVRIKNELSNITIADISHIQNDEDILTSTLSSRLITQTMLNADTGWKSYFGNILVHNYLDKLPLLDTLFVFSRRGSLQKEEGGMSPLGFPWSNKTYGKKTDGTSLSTDENAHLHELTQAIHEDFKGYAINNSDIPQNYILTIEDVLQQPTIEMKWQRGRDEFKIQRKTRNIIDEARTLEILRATPEIKQFIDTFREYKGLEEMPESRLWVGLREPVAGELIIPRKQRTGHRVFINSFAFNSEGRQVRVSSNFIYYSDFRNDKGKEKSDLVQVIAAFLVSSFGQLQFEMLGANREGCLSIEKHHLSKIRVINPNYLPPEIVSEIISAFQDLPFPIPTDRNPATLKEKRPLDQIFSQILSDANGWTTEELLGEVHTLLNEYLEARQP